MGDLIAASAAEFRPHSGRQPPRRAVRRHRAHPCGPRPESRAARGAADLAGGSRAADPRGFARTEHLAPARGDRDDDLLHRLALHDLVGALGHAADGRHLDRLVLADRQQGGRGVRQTIVRNVSDLPTYAYGPRSGPWWGAMGFMALEGMGFAIAIGAYLYLYAVNPTWPIGAAPPDLWPATSETVLFLLSIIPNEYTNRVAHRQDLPKVRIC